jgi:hypothetical protein
MLVERMVFVVAPAACLSYSTKQCAQPFFYSPVSSTVTVLRLWMAMNDVEAHYGRLPYFA